MKKRLSTALSLLVCLAMGLAAVPAAAAEPTTNDYHYYSLTFDQIESSNQSLNDPNWLKWLSVGDAEEAGVSCSWNDAVRNVRVQFPGEMNMDGFHAVFRNLEYTKGVIAFTFCERYMYGEYLENPSSNYLAALPTVLTVDLSNGRVQTYAAKPLTTVDSTRSSILFWRAAPSRQRIWRERNGESSTRKMTAIPIMWLRGDYR